MTDHAESRLPLARLSRQDPRAVHYAPSAGDLAEIGADLALLKLRKVSLVGTLAPIAARDWELTARLGATVTQPCVLTQAPVTTRLEEAVERRYLAEMPEPEGEEAEMPEDDAAEPLPSELDLRAVLTEALALALPLYPKAEGAALEQTVFAGPNVVPMTDEDAKPFAGLAALKDSLSPGSDEDDTDR